MASLSDDLKDKRGIILDDYYKTIRETEKYFTRDTQMAIMIQKNYRRYII